VFVHGSISNSLEQKLVEILRDRSVEDSQRAPERTRASVEAAELIADAILQGGSLLIDGIDRRGGEAIAATPTVVREAKASMRLLQSDVFAPVLSLVEFTDIEAALEDNDRCPYALGASIFSQESQEIEFLASRINAGCIVVNDLIVPTADPRAPFGGRKLSGFGVTRGAAGLQEMTQIKTVLERKGKWLPHLDSPTPFDAAVMSHLIKFCHAASIPGRVQAALSLTRGWWSQRKYRRAQRTR
jgi:acyl-CoA reductase-like NAD-dependent aldehyde dehydrogenase